MSSPRPDPKPVSLNLNTFGDSPAAIYLADCLNKLNQPLVARKVAKILAEGHELVADLARAHLDYDALSTRTFARLLPLIAEQNEKRVEQSLKASHPHIAHLTLNVLAGNLKVWKQRVQEARRKHHELQRTAGQGVSVPYLLAKPLLAEKTAEGLQQKSKRYLARKGKKDSLY